MKALHKLQDKPSLFSQESEEVLTTLESKVAALSNYVQNLDSSKISFEEGEEMIVQLTHEIGRSALSESLQKYDVSSDVISLGEKTYRKNYSSTQLYQTSFGPIKITRHLYRNRTRGEDGKNICPLEGQAGIIDDYWTPGAARKSIWALSHLTPQETEDLFLQVNGMNPSRSSLDRLPKALSEKWEPHTIDYHQQLICSEKIPDNTHHVSVSLDGVMIAMKPPKKAKKSDKKQRCVWREASCGTVSFFDKEGDRLSTIQYARMPEKKKETLKKLLQSHVEHIRSEHPEIELIHLADGAKDNWCFFDEQLPAGFQLVDFYHASEYLKKAFDAAYPTNQKKAKAQYDKYYDILKNDVNGAFLSLTALRYLRNKNQDNDIINSTVTYFSNNQHRMKYADAHALNFPIGSGVVEAACKSLVSQRIKRSGMSWLYQGGQAILTFRSLIKSNRFDKAWNIVARQYKKTVKTFENVVNLPV